MENRETRCLVLLSGGQDSTTCFHFARKNFSKVFALSFYYGQRHKVELECAKRLAHNYDVPHEIIDVSFLSKLSDSALIHKEKSVSTINAKGLPDSYVPNRNQLFLTLAHAYAQKIAAEKIVIGACQTDYSGYPDCRQDFIDALEKASNLGSEEDIKFLAPLMYLDKAGIWELAENLGCLNDVIHNSHTCYIGNHTDFNSWGYGCGDCPACLLRKGGYAQWKKN